MFPPTPAKLRRRGVEPALTWKPIGFGDFGHVRSCLPVSPSAQLNPLWCLRRGCGQAVAMLYGKDIDLGVDGSGADRLGLRYALTLQIVDVDLPLDKQVFERVWAMLAQVS